MTLTLTVTGPGTVRGPAGDCRGQCGAQLDKGTVVQLQPTADAGAIFSGWSGACSGSAACTLTLDGDLSVSAVFAQVPPGSHVLSVTVAGRGRVVSTPAGIDCSAGLCTAPFADGTAVTLTATPAQGATFAGFDGGCHGGQCALTMTADAGVSARFADVPVVTVTVTGPGTVSGSGISCGQTGGVCQVAVASGAHVALTAVPDGGAQFDGWGGACSGAGACTLEVAGSAAISATFETVTSGIAVAVTPTSATVRTGSITPFTAQVTGTTDPRVTWSVGEGASGGSMDASGNFFAAAVGTWHVVATSVADPSRRGAAVVTVVDSGIACQVHPDPLSVAIGTKVQFWAEVTGTTNSTVFWAADAGAMKQDGYWYAPGAPGTYHVTARVQADPSKSCTSTVSVTAPSVTVQITPATTTVAPTWLVDFKATVSNTTDQSVTWSLQEGSVAGTIDQLGQYIAGQTYGTYHVVATSNAVPSASAVAVVTVKDVPPPPPTDLVDNGGAIEPATRTFAVWWGDQSAFGADLRPTLEAVLGGLNGTPYFAVLDQYMRGAGASTAFAGSFTDSSPPPTTSPTVAQIGNEACAALDANGVTPRDGDMVFMISSTHPAMGGTCGWHTQVSCHGTNLQIAYLPNTTGAWCGMAISPECGGRTESAEVLGWVATHELAEAMTDPYFAGWKFPNGSEIADGCVLLATCVALPTGVVQLPALYSNAAHACTYH